MNQEFMNENDIEYTNSIMDKNHDLLFKIKDYNIISKKIIDLNEKIENIPIEYQHFFAEYDHLFHKAYEYEMCLMYFLGMKKGFLFNDTK